MFFFFCRLWGLGFRLETLGCSTKVGCFLLAFLKLKTANNSLFEVLGEQPILKKIEAKAPKTGSENQLSSEARRWCHPQFSIPARPLTADLAAGRYVTNEEVRRGKWEMDGGLLYGPKY